MTPGRTRPVSVRDGSSVGEARRHAIGVAEAVGLGPEQVAVISVIATELAVNLHLHGGGGELIASPLQDAIAGIQILAIDRGRGMRDVDRCLGDGFSTSGTAGQGLGAVRRMSSVFDLHSQARMGTQGGTVVLSQVHAARSMPPPLTYGGVCVPVEGEIACGDAWAIQPLPTGAAIVVVDGLGHGPGAAEAADEAIAAFSRRPAPVQDFLAHAHLSLRPTRGAALSVAYVDTASGITRFAGIGNVSGRLVTGPTGRSLLTHHGTLGLHMGRVAETTYPWPGRDGLLVMATDGILNHWTLDNYGDLQRRHPAVIAAVLYRDWRRERDDATVVVARLAQNGATP